MVHAHIFSWLVAIILFFIALSFHRSGKSKGFKIVKMVLRLFYVFIIISGVLLLIGLTKITLLYIVKAALGLWVIAMMEMLFSRLAKKLKMSFLWIQFALALLLVLYLGLHLPLGMHWF